MANQLIQAIEWGSRYNADAILMSSGLDELIRHWNKSLYIDSISGESCVSAH